MLPLALTLSQKRLRLISTLGMGVLVGTSLIVIIPEGIDALYNAHATVVPTHTGQGALEASSSGLPGMMHRRASPKDRFESPDGTRPISDL